jgi:hypothetical protein
VIDWIMGAQEVHRLKEKAESTLVASQSLPDAQRRVAYQMARAQYQQTVGAILELNRWLDEHA